MVGLMNYKLQRTWKGNDDIRKIPSHFLKNSRELRNMSARIASEVVETQPEHLPGIAATPTSSVGWLL
jgi:hypothetical protein